MTEGDLAREIAGRTDVYFNRTRAVVERFGDKRVTYAIFLRRPVISAPRLMLEWLAEVAAERGTTFDIDVTHPEGSWTGAGEPLAYIAPPASPPTTPTRWPSPCRKSASSPWMPATAPVPRCSR